MFLASYIDPRHPPTQRRYPFLFPPPTLLPSRLAVLVHGRSPVVVSNTTARWHNITYGFSPRGVSMRTSPMFIRLPEPCSLWGITHQ